LKSDEKYSTNKARVENRQELALILSSKIKEHKRKVFISMCIEKNVPAGAIRNLQEVFAEESAQELILKEGKTQRVRTVNFRIAD